MNEQVPSNTQSMSETISALESAVEHAERCCEDLVHVHVGHIGAALRLLRTAHEPLPALDMSGEPMGDPHPIDVARMNREMCDRDGHVFGVPVHECMRCHHQVAALGSTPPPAPAPMTLDRANEIAEDIAEAMRLTSRGEWVIDLHGGPFTADQLEAIAVIMRAESSETKGSDAVSSADHYQKTGSPECWCGHRKASHDHAGCCGICSCIKFFGKPTAPGEESAP